MKIRLVLYEQHSLNSGEPLIVHSCHNNSVQHQSLIRASRTILVLSVAILNGLWLLR